MITVNDLRPHQKKMLWAARDSVAQDRYLFIYGGQGTFKTTTSVISLWLILTELSRYYTGLRVAVGAINYKQLRDAFVATWEREVPAYAYEYDRQHEEISLCGQGFDTILLLRHAGDAKEGLSAERASKTRRGGSITGYYFPQAESLSLNYYSQVEAMLRATPTKRPGFEKYPPFRVRFLDANPEHPFHFLYKMFIDPTSETYIGDKAITVLVKMTPETTAYTPGQIETFRKTWSPHRIARMIEGLWVGASGLVYEAFSPATHVSEFEPPSDCEWYLAVDFGYRAPFCALLIGFDREGQTWVLDEFYEAGVELDVWAARIANWWPELNIRKCVADPEGAKWRIFQKHLKWSGRPIGIILPNKKLSFGIEEYTTRLKTPGLENIHKRCRNFQQELLTYEWDVNTEGRPIKEKPSDRGANHALDARRYFETTIVARRKKHYGQ